MSDTSKNLCNKQMSMFPMVFFFFTLLYIFLSGILYVRFTLKMGSDFHHSDVQDGFISFM